MTSCMKQKRSRSVLSALLGTLLFLSGCSQQTLTGIVLRATLSSEYGMNGSLYYTSTCKSGNFDCVAQQAAAICTSKGVDELVWDARPPVFTCNIDKK